MGQFFDGMSCRYLPNYLKVIKNITKIKERHTIPYLLIQNRNKIIIVTETGQDSNVIGAVI